MTNYLLQIDGTERDAWRTITAATPQDAIASAIGALLKRDPQANPTTAYVALTAHRHPNGTPIAVQSYTLELKRQAEHARTK